MKTDLAALLSRLEGGEASRELDRWIRAALAGPDETSHIDAGGNCHRSVRTWLSDAPPYTTSLDAAIALAERVLPGWGICIRVGAKAVATVVEPDKPDAAILDAWPRKWEAGAPKPALALTAAIVKAKIGEVG